uniref:MgtC/SapB family protein n=1 Tax=Methylocella sp. TaxID=1978226 RepID=UPI003785187C
MSQSFLASMLDLRLDPMTPAVDWGDVAARLAAAVAIGIALGFNRSESGKAAGMRTTALVTLAAALAMIEANVLIGTTGREPQAFAAIDPMRLPLGVLTGVGFIGAGAILRRDGLIVGVATAATL